MEKPPRQITQLTRLPMSKRRPRQILDLRFGRSGESHIQRATSTFTFDGRTRSAALSLRADMGALAAGSVGAPGCRGLLWNARTALSPFAMAGAGLSFPAQCQCARPAYTTPVAILIVYVGGVALIIGVIAYIVPPVVIQINNSSQLPVGRSTARSGYPSSAAVPEPSPRGHSTAYQRGSGQCAA